jgi:hypothetical protein
MAGIAVSSAAADAELMRIFFMTNTPGKKNQAGPTKEPAWN